MGQLTFNIPDTRMGEVTEAYGRGRGWQAEVRDPDNEGALIPNPESEAKYAKRQIAQDMQMQVKHYQGQKITAPEIT